MIIGTAGHIDHGKTALIRALTGIEADRLAEEKQRGLTIDLGFAYEPLADDGVLGFVDVPGHERFVPNMLSGALAIDYVVLVVAADDGPMPQTREHVAILNLLGLGTGVVALTKTDLVPAERLVQAETEVHALLADTVLAEADVFPVSSATGKGVPALRARLETVAYRQSPRSRAGYFRLAVDRVFSLTGTGTVVTGTVHSGSVASGERLQISPQGLEVRVRGIHAQNRAAAQSHAGDRCALNLAGRRVDRTRLARGDWVLAPEVHAPTQRFDARLRVLPTEPRPLRHWTPVHVHVGAADITGRVAVLDGERIEAGASGLVQIVLDRPVPALYGDRFVLRDQSATRTVAGGAVLDTFAPGRGRRRPERLALLAALEHKDTAAALNDLLAVRGVRGVSLAWFTQLRNLKASEAEAVYAGVAMQRAGARERGFAPAIWDALGGQLVAELQSHHNRRPDSAGLTESALLRELRPRHGRGLDAEALAALAAGLVKAGRIQRNERMLQMPGHQERLTPKEQQLWRRIEPKLTAGGLRPPRVREFAASLEETRDSLRALLRRQTRAGALWEVSPELFYPPGTIAALARATQRVGEAGDGRITVKSFREGTGVDRNVAVELLEFFDRTGLTLRTKDGRRLHGRAADLYGDRAQAQ